MPWPPVRTAGKRALAIDQALASSDANLLNAANVVWNLRAAVRGATCAVELASAKSVLAHEEWDLRIDLAARLEKQADAGVVSRYESARARLDRDGAAQRFRMSAAELNAARHDLAAVSGVPFAEIERRAIGQTCLASQSLRSTEAQAAAAATAVAARLDVRAKLAEFRAADAAWRTEIARRMPDLNLGPGYTYDQGDRKINFTVSGELPIFSHNDGAIARAHADRNRVIAEIEILQRAVLDGVERARDQLSAAEAGYSAALDAAAQTEQILNRDITRQQQGELDQPAVVVSRIALDVARGDVLVAERVLSDAVAAFEAAAQAPLAPPLFDGEAAQALLNAPADAAAGDTHK
jgi:outer membrane protein TolC